MTNYLAAISVLDTSLNLAVIKADPPQRRLRGLGSWGRDGGMALTTPDPPPAAAEYRLVAPYPHPGGRTTRHH